MARFFVDRPIVAMVISIIMVLVGLVSMLTLPVAQFPTIAPPEIQVQTTYVGADALTVEQAVAAPIEQQMSGVDNMSYMFSINSSNGATRLVVDFDVKTDPNIDHVLTQIRESQAESQLPADVRNYGVLVQKSTRSPLLLIALHSPNGAYDAKYLANYAFINLTDPLSRVPGIANVQVFGAGQYAMRFWVDPDRLAKLGITVSEIIAAVNAQNAVNPAGQLGAEPAPRGQAVTYAVRAQGRLVEQEEFAEIVIRAEADGSLVRLKDVARIELGSESYAIDGRLDGQPSAILALYQLPGSNAVDAASRVRRLMDEQRQRFPPGLDYLVALDTTQAVTEGLGETIRTLFIALGLVILVVFIFLQGWRATLIPLLAVPVSLIGTFVLFPIFGFSINTLSLFGLVLAIGLVVDDAIVVVEAVEHNIEEGLSPREATLKAMADVSSPVIATALILAAVFIPTIFLPGITGRLYQQFALTIAISVVISAFNALTLSPALAAMLLRPKRTGRGPLAWFFERFNRAFKRGNDGYISISQGLMKRRALTGLLLLGVSVATVLLATRLPTGFLPDEDQGYVYVNLQLPDAASLQRTGELTQKVEATLRRIPGIAHVTTVNGFSLLSLVPATYSALIFVTLQPWHERTSREEQYGAIQERITQALSALPEAVGFTFPPPAIPGVGTSGGVTFMLEDRGGNDVSFLAGNLERFLAAARKRPEIAALSSTFLPAVPQVFVDVDRDKTLKQGVPLDSVYRTLQTFMGGYFINYFNRFGRQWRVFIQADRDYRTQISDVSRFYVRNDQGDSVPLSALIKVEQRAGPEFTVRFNEYRAAQINGIAAPGHSSAQAMRALEEAFAETMPPEMGFDYSGMSFQERAAERGVPPVAVYGLSLLFVFLILAAQYESWSLPLSVLVSTPIAMFGAFAALSLRRLGNPVFDDDTYAQIGMVMLIGLAAKNAILIVAFAKAELERGRPLIEATLAGARLRLRPILMTSIAMLFGLLPLWIATGAGALSRRILGTAVIGGLLAATAIAIFVIPVAFYTVECAVARLGRRNPSP